MAETYRVSLVDFPDVERQEAIRLISSGFGVSEEMSACFLDRMPVRVKENAPLEEAREYVGAFVKLGAIASLENQATGRAETYSGAHKKVMELDAVESKIDAPPAQREGTTPSQPSIVDTLKNDGFETWVADRQPSEKERMKLKLAGLGLVAFVVAIAVITGGNEPPRVYLVNALGIPVQVRFGDTTVYLDPHTFELQEGIETGRHEVTTSTVFDEIISTEVVHIPDDEVVAAYNVLGAADIYTENLHYTTFQPGDHNTWEYFIGQTFAYQSEVVFAFVEPPVDMETPGFRRYFGFVEPEQWGWQVSLEILLENGQPGEARTLAMTIDRYDARAEAEAYLETLLRSAPSEDPYTTSSYRFR